MLDGFLSQINSTTSTAAAVIGLIYLAVTHFFKSFHLYDRHWSRRRHKLLMELRAAKNTEGLLAHYLDEAIFLESYRIASGVRTNRLKSEFLMRLAAIGHWNNYQIRQIAEFVVTSPEQPVPTFQIPTWQVVSARVSLFFGIFLLVLGCILTVFMIFKGATSGAIHTIFAAYGVETVFIIAAALVMSKHNTYTTARKFGDYVNEHPEIFLDNQCTSMPEDTTVQLKIKQKATAELAR
ncbi:hypothetical protein HX890_12710 [Pseudomonas gingeri]|uniref:hypothetical protein n=1 Tax=Pseudomonas gingeri TaxID=117681 RepID=UPI0015A3C964|nr:hypothetical protein [Pseudomonas gingeri]NWD74966.1 hypothetical protein [Pseudomonas gingeri]